MKQTLFLLLFFFAASLLSAHEFWLQPDKFIYKRGELINIRFLVGENFTGENWSGNNEKIQSLKFFYGDVDDESLGKNFGTQLGDSLQVAMLDEGTAMVAFNSTNSFIELDGKEFNAYLREDRLNDALNYRLQNDSTAKGREYYQRSVKTIFQVGDKKDNTYKKKTGLPIDIIPDDNPYNISSDGNFKVRVLYNNEPLKNHPIKVWHRFNDKLTIAEYTTDEEGEAKFFFSPAGQWMVSTVKMIRLPDDPKAEWQSYWGSMTWGYLR